MSTISSARIVISCLPVIGPAVGIYNFTENLIACDHVQKKIEKMANTYQALVAAPSQRLENFVALRDAAVSENNNLLTLCKKGVVYAKCGVVSSLLTMIGLVALATMGILFGQSAFVLYISCAILGLCHGYTLYEYNRFLAQRSELSAT